MAQAKIRQSHRHRSLSSLLLPAQVFFEQLQNPLVFIRPRTDLFEGVILHRIDRHFPILLAQFDQALRQAHRVLKMDVDIHHAVTDQQRALQTRGKVDR